MYKVDGFVFEDETTFLLACKEKDGVRFIKERTALDNPDVVYKLYNSLLEQKVFVTPVGIRFMLELQNVLLATPYLAADEIPPVPVAQMVVRQEKEPENQQDTAIRKATKKVDEKVHGEYKRPFYVALFFAIVFGISVLGMFMINKISGNNVTILNYKNALLDEYSGWEAQLQEKEAQLKSWEKELEYREEALR